MSLYLYLGSVGFTPGVVGVMSFVSWTKLITTASFLAGITTFSGNVWPAASL